MKFFKRFIVLSYFYTSLFIVHAFAMHGEAMEHHTGGDYHASSNDHSHGEETHHCQKGLSDEMKDANHLVHTDDSDHDHNSMMLCLTQSEGTLVNDTFAVKVLDIPLFLSPTPQYSLQHVVSHNLLYYIDDPGWGPSDSFATFLDVHVGSTLMNC